MTFQRFEKGEEVKRFVQKDTTFTIHHKIHPCTDPLRDLGISCHNVTCGASLSLVLNFSKEDDGAGWVRKTVRSPVRPRTHLKIEMTNGRHTGVLLNYDTESKEGDFNPINHIDEVS